MRVHAPGTALAAKVLVRSAHVPVIALVLRRPRRWHNVVAAFVPALPLGGPVVTQSPLLQYGGLVTTHCTTPSGMALSASRQSAVITLNRLPSNRSSTGVASLREEVALNVVLAVNPRMTLYAKQQREL